MRVVYMQVRLIGVVGEQKNCLYTGMNVILWTYIVIVLKHEHSVNLIFD